MGSNGSDAVMVSAVDEAECSETTVEIKIKTLDSQTYTLRVNKRVPVPELKEQIETVTGVVSEQQRLICRGKVLKDDQLLSAYHVEDGHTLHMVVRQPIPPSSTSPMGFSGLESLPDQSGTDPAVGTGQGGGTHVAHRVLLGSFNIADQGDGGIPDLNRIISAVLSSIGIPNMGSSAEGSDPMELGPDRLERAFGSSVTADSNQSQPDQHTGRVQYDPHHGAFRIPSPLGVQQLGVIPDSLTTLLQYLAQLRHEFISVGGRQTSINGERGHTTASQSDIGSAGLPTAASLAEVMLSTRQLLIDQVGECLSQLGEQLEDQRNVTAQPLRTCIQTCAIRTGISLQNLGALLLELGRTTMTLRMGQTPSDAVVNAGPAVFISTSGPNPIMVQPLQPGAGLGASPMGMMNAGSGQLGGSGLHGGSLGSGLFPRNIDIRIRAGPSTSSGNVNPGDQAGAQTVPERAANSTASVHQQGIGIARGSPFGREAGIRVVPIRTVVAAVPASASRPTSNSTGSSVGLFYPVLARVQHVAATGQSGQASGEDQTVITEADYHQLRSAQIPSVRRPDAVNNTQQSSQTRNDQELPSQSDQLPAESTNTEGGGMADANTNGTGPRLGLGEGMFLSRLLHQIIPLIPQNSDPEASNGSNGLHASENRNSHHVSGQTEDEPSVGSSHPRDDCAPPSPSSKRQKRE